MNTASAASAAAAIAPMIHGVASVDLPCAATALALPVDVGVVARTDDESDGPADVAEDERADDTVRVGGVAEEVGRPTLVPPDAGTLGVSWNCAIA